MEEAIEESKLSIATNDIPIGCIIIKNDKIIARAHNEVEKNTNSVSHAEIIAIKRAQKKLDSKYLNDCSMFVTLEPCIMCSGAISLSRIKSVYFSSFAPKFGALKSLYKIGADNRLNHRFNVEGGILEEKTSKILKDYFKDLRI